MADSTPNFHVVLHQPEIPPNTGNAARTCVATGSKLWLVKPLGFVIDDYHLRRAGCDYWEYLDWELLENWEALEQTFPMNRAWLFTKNATKLHYEISFQFGDVLIFGCESQGLPPAIRDKYPQQQLRIPALPQVRSLNLSNCVAIALYEALRQVQWKQR